MIGKSASARHAEPKRADSENAAPPAFADIDALDLDLRDHRAAMAPPAGLNEQATFFEGVTRMIPIEPADDDRHGSPAEPEEADGSQKWQGDERRQCSRQQDADETGYKCTRYRPPALRRDCSLPFER